MSKAIPANGGYIAGSRKLCDFLRSSARAFTFSGALPPTSTAAAIAAIRLIKEEPERVKRLQKNFMYFSKRLRDAGLNVMGHGTSIVPILCGSAEGANSLASHCARNRVFVHAVTPPAVPEGTSRLRASIISEHTREELDHCIEVITRGALKLGITR